MMIGLQKFLSTVLLAVIYASATAALQQPRTSAKHTTHRIHHISRELKLKMYHPESTFETFESGLDTSNIVSAGPQDLNSTARAFVQSRLGVDANTIGYRSGYTTANEKYAYVRQHHNGIPFVNAVANVAWKDSKVVSFGSSFVKSSEWLHTFALLA